jgi:hypothetical protein
VFRDLVGGRRGREARPVPMALEVAHHRQRSLQFIIVAFGVVDKPATRRSARPVAIPWAGK